VAKSSWENVVQAGLGQNPARWRAWVAGSTCACVHDHQQSVRGLKAVGLAAQSVILGEAEIVVAAGWSRCRTARTCCRRAHRLPVWQRRSRGLDGDDGLWTVYNDFHMGITAELWLKIRHHAAGADQFALESHQRAVRARKSCFIESQIVPVEIPRKKSEPVVIII